MPEPSDQPTRPHIATTQTQRLNSYLESHPDQIGPYRILEPVGEGGMGVVYKAEQRTPRRVVALKLIKLGMDTKEVIARFEAERQALAVMDHPNVARVYDAGATEQGRPYFVMEYVSGEPITSYCDKHKLTVKQRLELFAQICEAVQHAHTKGIIHRDIKPTNVLVTLRDGNVAPKVIDFGVAKACGERLTERTLFTSVGQLIGTPEYMSPEQAELTQLDIDARSDIYSLGVLLYELLTGTLPFEAKLLRQVAFGRMQQILREQDPPPPSTRLSSLSIEQKRSIAQARRTRVDQLALVLKHELEWIPLKALRKDRTERYRTASELADDVRNYLSGRPLIAAPESSIYRIRKFVKRNRMAMAVAGAFLLLLASGLVVTTTALIREAHARRQANEARDNAQALNEFLRDDMIAAAAPDVALKSDATVSEVMNRAANSIGQRFEGRPLIEATIRNALAEMYVKLGDHERALPQAERALEIRRRILGNAHPQAAETVRTVAHIRRLTGDQADADRLFHEAYDILRRAMGEDHRETLRARSDIGFFLDWAKKHEEAVQVHREVLERRRRVLGSNDTDVLDSLNNLAVALHNLKQYREELPFLQEAFELCRRTRGQDHPDTLTCQSNLAQALQQFDRFEEAEQLMRDALARSRRVLSDEHPDTLGLMKYLGSILYSMKRYPEAEGLLLEALAGRRKLFGDSHRSTLSALEALASVSERVGKIEQAEQQWRELWEVRRLVLGDEDRRTLAAQQRLARVLDQQNKKAEADRVRATTQAVKK
jgi:serine/threonine protein kinase